MYSAAEGKGVYTKKELLRQIAVSLGGRAAELVYYGEEEGLSTGHHPILRQQPPLHEK